MDRNMLIGFLLIGLMILLIPKYNEWVSGRAKSEKKAPEPQRATDLPRERVALREEEPAEKTRAQLKPGEDVEAEARVWSPSAFTPRTVVIENKVFRGEISTQGGVIKKWYLKEFRAGAPKAKDVPFGDVQLLGKEGSGLALTWDNRREVKDLSDVQFVPDRDSLIVAGDTQGTITFVADLGNGKRIERQLGIDPDGYVVDLSLVTRGFDDQDRIRTHWMGRLGDTEGDPMASVRYGQICTYVGGELKRHKLGKTLEPEGVTSGVGGGWVGVRNKYFLVALIPDQQTGWEGEVFVGKTQEDEPADTGFYVVGGLEKHGVTVSQLYLGPIQHDRLRELGMGLEYAMDLGWPVVRHIARVMLPLFLGLHRVFPNYGLVIIVFSVLVKVVVYPLTHKSYAASAKMQKLQPQMSALREQYKDDPQEMNKQTMKLMVSLKLTDQSLEKLRQDNVPDDIVRRLGEELRDIEHTGEKAFIGALEATLGKQKATRYKQLVLKYAKKARINPMGGCLPMLVQMPVFFALYQVLSTTIELRQAAFVWWLTDLSRPDPWKVLPILMGLTSFIQQKMMMKDPKQKAMVYVMPVFMTFIFFRFASGLVLYWTMFNVLSVGQQAVMERKKKPAAEAA